MISNTYVTNSREKSKEKINTLENSYQYNFEQGPVSWFAIAFLY